MAIHENKLIEDKRRLQATRGAFLPICLSLLFFDKNEIQLHRRIKEQGLGARPHNKAQGD